MECSKWIDRLGHVITRLRKEKQMSQAALGKLSGTSQMTIQRIESGGGSGSRLDAIKSISEVLDVSLADIFFESENGQDELKTQDSNWADLHGQLNRLTPSEREWISSIIGNILSRP